MATPLRKLRVSDLDWERWGWKASEWGMSVSELIRYAVERQVDPPMVSGRLPEELPVKRVKGGEVYAVGDVLPPRMATKMGSFVPGSFKGPDPKPGR